MQYFTRIYSGHEKAIHSHKAQHSANMACLCLKAVGRELHKKGNISLIPWQFSKFCMYTDVGALFIWFFNWLCSLAEGSSFFTVRESFQFRSWSFSFYNVFIHVLTFKETNS